LQHTGTLQTLSGHYETGEPLPDAQVEGLAKVQQHLAGYELCRELYLSSLDLELHTT
jgi:oligopeptidase A